MRRAEILDRRRAEAYRDTFAPSLALRATVPPGWEGLYFPYDSPLAGLRPDGSPHDDGVAVDLPRRMYAGEDTEFLAPLLLDRPAEQRVRVGEPVRKRGRNGALVFVDVERDYLVDGVLAVRSVWHDVFLESPPPAAAPAPDETFWEWQEPLRLDSRQLFRFSALTFNTHRVHYDRDWARGVEELPDLLVHGPLARMLLLDLAARWSAGRRVSRASVRLAGPLFVDTELGLAARAVPAGLELAILGPDGDRRATASVVLAS